MMDEGKIIMYHLSYMLEQDIAAIANAKSGVEMMNHKIGTKTLRGGSQDLQDAMPKYFCHGTHVDSAYQICMDGKFTASKGGAAGGPGVYFLEMGNDLDEATIIRGWAKSEGSGYNHGAIIIAKLYGLVTPTDSKTDDLPAGAIGTIDRKPRQYSAHLSTIEFVAAVFDVDGLDDVLGKAMERASGYTPAARVFSELQRLLGK